MKQDNQHLDYLISQYVDGCLEGPGKKSVEQQMVNDPDARKLYADHRETQDLLDDWGNRIPLIDWDDFDKKLAHRLETETVGADRKTGWRRWIKPMAAAAALFIAATVGYGLRGIGSPRSTPVETSGLVAAITPHKSVEIEGVARSTQPSHSRVWFTDDGAVAGSGHWVEAGPVAVTPPEDSGAAQSLIELVYRSLPPVSDIAKPHGAVGASGTAVNFPIKDERESALP